MPMSRNNNVRPQPFGFIYGLPSVLGFSAHLPSCMRLKKGNQSSANNFMSSATKCAAVSCGQLLVKG